MQGQQNIKFCEEKDMLIEVKYGGMSWYCSYRLSNCGCRLWWWWWWRRHKRILFIYL